MIKYTLKCENQHEFESWFQSADAFDTLKASGMATCAVCGSASVEKTLMAPRVTSKDDANLSTPANAQEQALAAMREHVETNSEYVGMKFAQEARSMNDGDTPERAIYGEANREEAKKLIEDGVPVVPLPFVPNKGTN